MKPHIAVIAVAFVQACQLPGTLTKSSSEEAPITEKSPNQKREIYAGWAKLHKDDPELAAVDFMYEGEVEGGHVDLHPPGVLYTFFDGRRNQVEHKPDGTVRANFWWDIGLDSQAWDHLSYELGNDPSFKDHEDPRLRRKRLLDKP